MKRKRNPPEEIIKKLREAAGLGQWHAQGDSGESRVELVRQKRSFCLKGERVVAANQNGKPGAQT